MSGSDVASALIASFMLFVYGYLWKWLPRIWLFIVSTTLVPLFLFALSQSVIPKMPMEFSEGIFTGSAITSGGWALLVIWMNYAKVRRRRSAGL